MSIGHATDGGFHQERYCAEGQFDKRLLANLVAKKCETLSDASDRKLILAVQKVSHEEGLEKLSTDLLKRFPDQIGTDGMRRFGMAAGQVYTPDQAKFIAEEIASAGGQAPLLDKMRRREQGKRMETQAAIARRLSEMAGDESGFFGNPVEGPRPQPGAYALSEILDLREVETELLPKLIARLCVDPSYQVATLRPWWFASVVECLRQFIDERIAARRASLVPTQLSRGVYEGLDFILAAGGMVVLEGPALCVGKSFAAKSWCELHPGEARYFEAPPAKEDTAFYRAVAKAIGSASALVLKGARLRERVERALRSSRLMLVVDNAHYLLPQSNRREALPSRLNWLLALMSSGVPVALVTTPQFARDMKILQKHTGWTSAQFSNLMSEYQKLPQVLSEAELTAIVEHWLPTAEQKSIQAIAFYAVGSGRYLVAIKAVVKRARYIAGKAGREAVTFSDVKEAIDHYVIPSDQALTTALERGASQCPADLERDSTPAPDAQAAHTADMSAGPARSFTRGGRSLDHIDSETLSATLK